MTGSWLWPGVPLFFLAPYVIGRDHVMLRALACVITLDLCLKLLDYMRELRTNRSLDRSFTVYAGYLVPFPLFLVLFRERIPRTRPDVSGLPAVVVGVIVLSAGFILLPRLSDVDAVRSSFFVDHTLKFFLFALVCDAMARGIDGLERCVGYQLRPLIDHALLSRTVVEFWCRYNTRVHAWLEHNVFLPAGGRRAPLRGLCFVFFVSALFHEIAFGVTTSRFDGYQFAFFMLQVPAIITSRSLEHRVRSSPTGRRLCYALTVLWFWLTSMLFFHGVDRVFPFFYVSEPWLP
ncbi:MAG TPA: MBOAT family O-acyltransferase [Planctomycetaceae bacterium]|nr:MBOAT family O-acyltransferase [Planctomycetaceae bacterium]